MKVLISALGLIIASHAFAGAEGGGGGDPCENRIKTIALDIHSWILNGGPVHLKLPTSISVEEYSTHMRAEINKSQILCVGDGEPGYPVQVNKVPKVCRFDKDKRTSKITCDAKKFQALTDFEQYVLVHHEYAGLAGIEQPQGADSRYEISNQISEYLEDRVVKMLAVKANKPPHPTEPKGFLFVSTAPRKDLDEDLDLTYVVKKCIEFRDSSSKDNNECLKYDWPIQLQMNRLEPLEPGRYQLFKMPKGDDVWFTITSSNKTTLQMRSLSPNDLQRQQKNLEVYFSDNERYLFQVQRSWNTINYRLEQEALLRSDFENNVSKKPDPSYSFYNTFNFSNECTDSYTGCNQGTPKTSLSLAEILSSKEVTVQVDHYKRDTIITNYPVVISHEARRFLDFVPLNPKDGFYLNEYSDDGLIRFANIGLNLTVWNTLAVVVKYEEDTKAFSRFLLKNRSDISKKKLLLMPGEYVIKVFEHKDLVEVLPFRVQ